MHFRALGCGRARWGRTDAKPCWWSATSRTYAGAGDVEHALEFQRRADDSRDQMGLSRQRLERQKLAFVRGSGTDGSHDSLHLREARDNPDAASLAAGDPAAQGPRADAMANLFGAVRRRVPGPPTAV
jgi:hypothetical protein